MELGKISWSKLGIECERTEEVAYIWNQDRKCEMNEMKFMEEIESEVDCEKKGKIDKS